MIYQQQHKISFINDRTRGYLQGSNNDSSFCSFSSLAFVGMVTIALCRARAAFTGSWCLNRRFTISKVKFHRVGSSCTSASVFRPCATCCFSNSVVFGGLCLKWPTSLRHFKSAPSNALFCRDTVTVCWVHGKCSNDSCLEACTICGLPE